MNMGIELERIKQWARETSKPPNVWDTEYPDWHKLISSAEISLRSRPMNPAEVMSLLEILALDHESEVLRDALASEPANGILLAQAGLNAPYPDARWQLADFLGTRSEPEAISLLRRFMDDPDEYVRRRALLAAQYHDPAFAEGVAVSWLKAKYEYSRLAALDVLINLKSKHLPLALETLKEDPTEMIRKKITNLQIEIVS